MTKESPLQNVLFEIGSEEIPASYIPPALDFMKARIAERLEKDHLPFQSITTYGTPRRLVVIINGVPAKSEAQTEEVLGPSLRAAKSPENEWTQAAKGFAQTHGKTVADIQVRQTKKGEYICVVKKHEGIDAKKLLSVIFNELIPAIPFPKKMIWNATQMRFARPLRSLIALYGSKVISVQAAGVKSGNKTFPLSHMNTKPISIESANKYVTTLKNHCILTDPAARREAVLHSAQLAAQRVKGHLKEDLGLLEEVIWLVEHPVIVLGTFEEEFLELPQEVLITCMKKHQKFFSILDSKGKLMPYFIAVRNGISEHQDGVRKGYEKVLKARLVDAKFFYSEDFKKPLEHHLEKSKTIALHEKLGTLRDKIARIQSLSAAIAQGLGQSFDAQAIQRGAELSKFDLTTSMVYEFPELQGTVGEIYARRYNESETASRIVREHYYPLTNQSELPKSAESAIVALADKLDGLVGNMLIGFSLSGSADPYGLRRQSTGIIRILLEFGWALSFKEYVQKCLALYPALSPSAEKQNEILNSFVDRFQLLMQDQGYAFDEIHAVTKNLNDPDRANLNFLAMKNKIIALHSLRDHPNFTAIAGAFKRATNILKQARQKSIGFDRENFSESLLRDESERELHKNLHALAQETEPMIQGKKYKEALEKLVGIRASLDLFFEKVMVMDPAQEIAQNRLAMLAHLEYTFKQLADFSLIQSTGENN